MEQYEGLRALKNMPRGLFYSGQLCYSLITSGNE